MLTKINKSTWIIAIAVFVVIAAFSRFVKNDVSPPGFYVDEAAISAQVICLRQSGNDLNGKHLPLFSEVLGGGLTTPPYLYLGVAWTAIFGDSISAMRSFAGFFSLLTIIGVFILSWRLWREKETAWLCALGAAISPWAFQFSRIAWDPALAPCFLIWSLVFLFETTKAEKIKQILIGLTSGLLMALAMYAYPPVRVQTVLILPAFLLIAILIFQQTKLKLYFFLAGFVVTSLPLTWMTFTGELQGRFNMLSILNASYLAEHGGNSIWNIARIFLTNMGDHLSMKYLLLSGDGNLRHSTNGTGMWSWLDTLGVIGALGFFLMKLQTFGRNKAIILVLIWSYIAGIIPAALTWESNPHALRSIGASPFLSLIAGSGLAYLISLHRYARVAIGALAIAFSLWFARIYWVDYPLRADIWFDTMIVKTAQASQSLSAEEIKSRIHQLDPAYQDLAIAYYQLHYGKFSCR